MSSAAQTIHVPKLSSPQGEPGLPQRIAALLDACRINPENAETFFDLGNLLYRVGNIAAAVSAFRQAAGLAPGNGAVWHNLGNALVAANSGDGAGVALREAVRLEPTNAGFLRAMAIHCLQTGDRKAAHDAFARLVSLDPADGMAHLNLADIEPYEPDAAKLDDMRRRFESASTPPASRIAFGFTLFRVFDNRGETEKAFHFLENSNRLRRASFGFDAGIEERLFAEFRRFFTANFFAAHASGGFADIAPIFIIGMPRSGSTLAEQILTCHSEVDGGGESTAMTETIAKFLGNGQGLSLSEEAFSPANLQSMGRYYGERMGSVVGASQRFTDKMPLNFRWLGVMAAMLPNARFVHCRRDPLDTCFSIYSSHFASNGNRYGYDQAELGRYYSQYAGLMAHWHSVLPGRVFDLPLEGLIADQEDWTRKLLDFCGLDFQPACLDFQNNRNRVTTLSAVQVRQPLNAARGGRARKYMAYLARLQTALDGAG